MEALVLPQDTWSGPEGPAAAGGDPWFCFLDAVPTGPIVATGSASLVKTGKAERISSVLMAIVLCQTRPRPVHPAAGVAVHAGVALG